MTPEQFLDYVRNEGLNKIFEVVDADMELSPIKVEFMGRTIEINLHADNYDALATFIQTVVENESE